jgi:hypothetical protein
MTQLTCGPLRARLIAAAMLAGLAGLLAGCGGSPGPAAHPTATVTVTATPTATASGAASTPTSAATPPGPPGCASTALTARLGPGSGAAGSSYYPVELTNSSSSTCSLYGYPGVSFIIAASGSQIGASAIEDPAFPRRLVTLAPGATAHAVLQVVDARNYPASTCHPVTAHSLRIYPPGQTTALSVSFTATACAATSVPILGVQTVQPGSGAR